MACGSAIIGAVKTAVRVWEFPVDDSLILVRPDVPGLFLLNHTARMIWDAVAEGSSMPDLVSKLVGRFEIHPQVARRDIEETVASWNQSLLAPLPAHPSFPLTSPDPATLCRIDCLVNGKPLRVFLQEGEVWEEIAPRLNPLRTQAGEVELSFAVIISSGRVLVFRGSQCIGVEDLVAGARGILLQAMVSHTEPAAILHAGGCGGILLAGVSYSGKSTLCAALMAGGLPYHCDDSAVLDHDFQVYPMPFPLVLRRGSWPLIEDRLPAFALAPRQLRQGLEARFLAPLQTSGPAQVTALVFVQHQEGAETVITEMGSFDTLMALQNTGFWVEHTEQGIQRFLAWLGSIRKISLRYSQLKEAEVFISGLAAKTGANLHRIGGKDREEPLKRQA